MIRKMKLAIVFALSLTLALVPATASAAIVTGVETQRSLIHTTAKIGKNVVGKANSKSVFFYGWKNGRTHYALKKTVKTYDVTGDKKADKLKVTLTPQVYYGRAVSGQTSKLTIRINGKTCKTITNNGGSGSQAIVRVLTLKNNKPFIYVQYTGNNADGTYALYQYSGGKLKTVLSNALIAKSGTSHNGIAKITPSGNKVGVTFSSMMGTTGSTRIGFTYHYKSGTLKLSKAKSTKIGYSHYADGKLKYPKGNLTAALSFDIFTNTRLSTRATTIYKGEKVKMVAIAYQGNHAYLKVKSNGKSGWLEVKYLPYGVGSIGGTFFDECYLAG